MSQYLGSYELSSTSPPASDQNSASTTFFSARALQVCAIAFLLGQRPQAVFPGDPQCALKVGVVTHLPAQCLQVVLPVLLSGGPGSQGVLKVGAMGPLPGQRPQAIPPAQGVMALPPGQRPQAIPLAQGVMGLPPG